MQTRLEHKENQAKYRPESLGVMLELERRLQIKFTVKKSLNIFVMINIYGSLTW